MELLSFELKITMSKIEQDSKEKSKVISVIIYILKFLVIALFILGLGYLMELSRNIFIPFFPTNIFLSYIFDLIIILVAIRIVWGVTPFSKKRSLSSSNDNLLKEHVDEIFESNEFHTNLRNALPKFDGDEKKIWQVLNSMIRIADRNRKRFETEYKYYFKLTLIVGICLSAVFLSMSYFFLYEASTEAEKAVVNLETQVVDLAASMKKIESDTVEDLVSSNLVNNGLRSGTFNNLNPHSKKLLEEIGKEFNKVRYSDFKVFVVFNDYLRKKLEDKQKIDESVYNNLLDTVNENQSIINAQKDISQSLPITIEKIGNTATKAKETFAKPENKIPNTIKRLFITIGVLAFFLGILRYFAKLYRENFLRATAADENHMLLKKFFITYKCANTDEERQKVLTTFLSFSNQTNVGLFVEDKDTSANNAIDMFKEIAAVFKKVG